MPICPDCNTLVAGSYRSASHRRKCIEYLEKPRNDIQRCPCKYKPFSLSDRSIHKSSCPTWLEKISRPKVICESQECIKCRKNKLSLEFPKNSYKLNGLSATCRSCIKMLCKGWRENNSLEIKNKAKINYDENQDDILKHKRIYSENNREMINLNKSRYWYENKEKITDRRRIKQFNLRKSHLSQARASRKLLVSEAMKLLGHECAICNEIERSFLTVDHVNNNGVAERKEFGPIGWKLRFINSGDISSYRILCMNCNVSTYRINPIHHLKKKEIAGQNKTCSTCGIDKDHSEFAAWKKDSSLSQSLYYECSYCKRFRSLKDFMELLELLGKECACCGINQPNKLVVDHVNNDGSFRRKDDSSGHTLYRRILSGILKKEDFQILCMNCNYSKHQNGGTCIHKKLEVRPEVIDFDFKSLGIRKSKYEESCQLLNSFHYDGFGRSQSALYGSYLLGKILSVAKFASPIRLEVASSVGLKFSEVLELDRLCVDPGYQKKNFVSFFLSRVVKLVRDDFPHITHLVSFADPRFGHSGIIYRASNWKYIGETRPSYYYNDPDGKEIHKKTFYEHAKKVGMNERAYMEKTKSIRIWTKPKHKFVLRIR